MPIGIRRARTCWGNPRHDRPPHLGGTRWKGRSYDMSVDTIADGFKYDHDCSLWHQASKDAWMLARGRSERTLSAKTRARVKIWTF
jgi:hypothetical protein